MFRVTISDHIPFADQRFGFAVDQVSRDLQHPLLVRIPGDSTDRYFTSGKCDHKQNVVRNQPLPAPYFYGKEVTSRERLPVRLEKPTRGFAGPEPAPARSNDL